MKESKKEGEQSLADDSEDINSYKYVSIVVAKEVHHDNIRKMLKKYNIDALVKAPLSHITLKGASHSGILYHNVHFDDIANVVSYNNDFKFEGRYLLIIYITDYLKLTDRNQNNQMSQVDF